MRKPFLLLFTLLLSAIFVSAQPVKSPDEFLIPQGKDSLPAVFLIGSFHFQYYNKDEYKVDKSKQVDILSDEKQKELKALLDYISLFKPTKICIEAPSKWDAMSKYRLYKSGKKELEKDEIQQVVFRLMEKFNLDTVYNIDANSIADELTDNKDSLIIRPYIDSIFKNYTFSPNPNYTKWLDYETGLSLSIPLFEYFKYLNSQKRFERDYGYYLQGDFKNGRYDGADALATYWYDRNLRIFRNIQRITTSPKDRILVLYGAGHISILDQLLKCSIEYNYIKFNELAK
ncbi:hypothetical protein BH10BAC3_BH10BAC3_41000 [soil metagenome]